MRTERTVYENQGKASAIKWVAMSIEFTQPRDIFTLNGHKRFKIIAYAFDEVEKKN